MPFPSQLESPPYDMSALENVMRCFPGVRRKNHRGGERIEQMVRMLVLRSKHRYLLVVHVVVVVVVVVVVGSVMHAVLIATIFCRVSLGRLLHSLPEDTYAFPKYKVSFLNSLPILNQTAERWLKDGLDGGEAQFLEQPYSMQSQSIESGDAEETTPKFQERYSLEHMKLGPRDSYLCLIPPPLLPPSESPLPPSQEEDATPAHSWSLLQPLSGSCLYHRQGWFTYSYCHDSEIRQFKELMHGHAHASTPEIPLFLEFISGTFPSSHSALVALSITLVSLYSWGPDPFPSFLGGYKPEEDPKWESYTLGKAPPASTDVALREGTVELARGAGSRYLVQRWGDGTTCDKTGKSREVEVQFHCSMAMSDTILFVKESKTCSYVLVINTPRLCGEPGFKSRRDVTEQSIIRCREIVREMPNPLPVMQTTLDFPHKLARVKAELPPAPVKKVKGGSESYDDLLRKAVDVLFGSGGKVGELEPGKVVVSDDGEVVVEIFEDLDDLDVGKGDGALADRLIDALRAAGIEVATQGEEEEEERIRDEL
ncbi:uncharacterized protein BT62DRAFT_989723 [Guyanagaster necrorhizus]|uniref:Protein OS-9 homolog n=1 Tax=Guyanagaster necrorhizus TaxID=856835 RepID=A0A9P8AYK5_9AGAR|nr:uncharacterized protein BT62DRAFT_989723 [Guyanagaster necrorhizus MCA 3950]KAG7452600.1 hypothetical protein BT62DRAFT_989723 [Guyanagaster necrorhizus MCA 3950]